MRFTWDSAKAKINQRVHGISFESAREVFHDPHHLAADNYFIGKEGEQRYQVIGMTGRMVLLLVVFAERNQFGSEVIRIISARKAVEYEKAIYEEQIR